MSGREFKFRVWDKGEKRFIEWYNPDPYISCGDGQIYCHERRPNSEDILTNERFIEDKLIVQQYIGLKDKNGTEIYEGDIVKFNHIGETFKFIGIVEWFAPACSFTFDRKVCGAKIESCENLEILGNISENPFIATI